MSRVALIAVAVPLGALALATSLGIGCSAEDERRRIDPADVYGFDVFGELASVDVTGWVEQPRAAEGTVMETPGGPRSEMLVGPGTLRLTDGTSLAVAPNTPGGNLCPLLDLVNVPPDASVELGEVAACVVIAAITPGTSTPTWFATEIVHRHRTGGYLMTLQSMGDGRAILQASSGVYFAAPIAAEIFVRCGAATADSVDGFPGAAFSAVLSPTGEVQGLECLLQM